MNFFKIRKYSHNFLDIFKNIRYNHNNHNNASCFTRTRTRTRSLNADHSVPAKVLELIFGALIEDSYCESAKSKARITFKHSDAQKDYLFWKHEFLSSRGYCNTRTPEEKK